MPATATPTTKRRVTAHKAPARPARIKQAKPTKWGKELLSKMEAFRKALATQK